MVRVAPPLLLSIAVGCAGLQLTPIKSAQQRPSNVAVYFKVQKDENNPVGGMTADQFRIYEDGGLVSQFESKQTILNPEVAASHYTLLLVDMSGSVSSDQTSVDTLVQAAGTLTERVEKSHKVGIYAFDGSIDLHPIVPFTTSTGSTKEGVKELSTFKPKDPSTNLNGAVVKGLEELDKALSHAEQPMRFGTLVIFTDGTDHAARVSADVMRDKVKDSKYDVFAIGLGTEIKKGELEDIGRNGTAMAADKNAVVKAFDDIGAKIEARTKSYYLLSYCSPARAGKHEVRIEAVLKDAQGKNETTGSLRTDFDATGFGPGCDPNTPPSFDVSKGDALAPPPKDKGDDKDAKKDDKKAEGKPAPASTGKSTSSPPPKLPPPPPPTATQPPAPPPSATAPSTEFNP
jgi:hypothetical protein